MAILTEQKKTQVITLFNYEILSPKKRNIVQQRTEEIKERLRRTAQDVWEVGQKLVEVRSQLEYGQFDGWLSAEFGWSRRTAYNFINVYKAFSENTNFAHLDIAASALYKLAAPSTPKSVRHKILDKAQKGKKITHKEISQALKAPKNFDVVEKLQPISPPSQKILQVIPKAKARLEVQEVQKTLIDERLWRWQSKSKGLGSLAKTKGLPAYTREFDQTPISSESVINPTQIEIEAGCWYIFDRINVLFCGDTASGEFCHRSPETSLALAITSDDWDHDWLVDKVSNLIVLKESYLREGLIEQIIFLFSAEGDTVIFPWLPQEEMLAIAHRLKRRIVAGDPSPERCQKAIRHLQ